MHIRPKLSKSGSPRSQFPGGERRVTCSGMCPQVPTVGHWLSVNAALNGTLSQRRGRAACGQAAGPTGAHYYRPRAPLQADLMLLTRLSRESKVPQSPDSETGVHNRARISRTAASLSAQLIEIRDETARVGYLRITQRPRSRRASGAQRRRCVKWCLETAYLRLTPESLIARQSAAAGGSRYTAHSARICGNTAICPTLKSIRPMQRQPESSGADHRGQSIRYSSPFHRPSQQPEPPEAGL